MNALVKDVWEELKAAYPEKPLALKATELQPAYGDGTLLRQVLVNLLSYAIKFSANRKRIVVEVGSNEKNGGNEYPVKDKGVGFDMKYYDKLFGVFQRLHNASEFQKTGIGLSIA
jgi:light-regulated signal transduction histidine kinase (bacteriophytochrome)